jgi:DNA-directed RNA polymerase alpha subunit
MQFENVTKVSPLIYTFRLSPTHVAYANTLRRLIMTGVESVAFRADMTSHGTTTDVSILNNSTPMTNEMLAHRIGLLPISVKEPLKWNPDRFTFRLTVNGNKETLKDVFSSDFTVSEKIPNEVDPIQVDSSAFFPVNPITRQSCLIGTLYPGEKNIIDIVARATVGT